MTNARTNAAPAASYDAPDSWLWPSPDDGIARLLRKFDIAFAAWNAADTGYESVESPLVDALQTALDALGVEL